jgi:hypothetical protein
MSGPSGLFSQSRANSVSSRRRVRQEVFALLNAVVVGGRHHRLATRHRAVSPPRTTAAFPTHRQQRDPEPRKRAVPVRRSPRKRLIAGQAMTICLENPVLGLRQFDRRTILAHDQDQQRSWMNRSRNKQRALSSRWAMVGALLWKPKVFGT